MSGETKDKIRNTLANEAKFIISLVVFVLGAAAPYYGIRQDIALIQKDIEIINSNHLTHIQDITQDMKEMRKEQIELQKQILILSR